MDGAHRAVSCTREAEAEVVVAVRRLVPVAVRRTAVVGVVVPGAAAHNPVGARIPSAIDDASRQDLAAHAIGIGMRDMGEQAGAALAELA